MKQLLAKHCAIAHGYFTKSNLVQGPQATGCGSARIPVRNRTAFHLLTTPMTRAARCACPQIVRVKKLARRPFKLVDLGELNREWFKETRNITQLLGTRAAKRFDRLGKLKLDVKLINRIHRARARLLKKRNGAKVNGSTTNGTNGHADDAHTVDGIDEDEDEATALVIDYDNPDDKPEFLKYFENKCTSPCFTPERLAFPKPSAGNFHKTFGKKIFF